MMDLPAAGQEAGSLAGISERGLGPGPLAPRARYGLQQVICPQGGPVADQPQVAERVDKAALPVNAPGCLVITDLVDAAVGSSRHGALDEAVRIVDEYLDPDRSRAKGSRGVPAVVLGLAEKERGTGNSQADHATKIP